MYLKVRCMLCFHVYALIVLTSPEAMKIIRACVVYTYPGRSLKFNLKSIHSICADNYHDVDTIAEILTETCNVYL